MFNKLFRRKNLEEAKRAQYTARKRIAESERVRQEEKKWREQNNFGPLITQAIKRST